MSEASRAEREGRSAHTHTHTHTHTCAHAHSLQPKTRSACFCGCLVAWCSKAATTSRIQTTPTIQVRERQHALGNLALRRLAMPTALHLTKRSAPIGTKDPQLRKASPQRHACK